MTHCQQVAFVFGDIFYLCCLPVRVTEQDHPNPEVHYEI